MSEIYVHNHWSTGEPVKVRNKTYRVGKMSYGDYFLEQKKDWNRPETENHSNDTLWLHKEIKDKIYTKNYILS